MNKILPKSLIALANNLDSSLFVVGGAVRNFLIDGSLSADIDLSGAIDVGQFLFVLKKLEISTKAIYPRMGTIKFNIENYNCEYTAFRREEYVGGKHVPEHTEFTKSIEEDALRRDFKCNAIYYDIKNAKIIDVVGGVLDVKNKVLDTVREPEIVFSSDGLRLLRLARFAGELNFRPTYNVIKAAKKYSNNILDVSPERIYSELKMILVSDCKYHFSDKIGHYTALKILDETRVLDKIFPELTQGRAMAQRSDFHKYDVLEHSIRTAMYSPPSLRLAGLLHDIGKPFCYLRDQYYYYHFIEGEKIVVKVLKRLKADKQTISKVKFLVREHMVDLDCSMSEKKLRKYLVKNYENLSDLLAIKQADYRASLEVESLAPTLIKWGKLIDKMKTDGTPFSLKDLKISAKDLIELGYKDSDIGKELRLLLDYAVSNPKNNKKEILLIRAKHNIRN